MKEKVAVSKRLSENIAQMEEFFHECDDIKKKELMLGRQMDVACYLTFIEVSVDMGTSALSEVLKYLKGLGKEEIYQALEQNALGISDATYFDTIEDAVDGLNQRAEIKDEWFEGREKEREMFWCRFGILKEQWKA